MQKNDKKFKWKMLSTWWKLKIIMDKNSEIQNNSVFSFINIITMMLSIYVMVALLVDITIKLDKETHDLLMDIDNAICIYFLIEFSFRFIKANNKLVFMKWGWIDLISSIPMVDPLRFGRIVRLIRIFRVIRAFNSMRNLIEVVSKNRIKSAFTSVVLLAIMVVIFSSIAIIQVENDPNSNIKTAEDALWWSYVTITTVGYGDKFPVTSEGRIIGVILMTFGVGLFGTFTALISSIILKEPSKN